MTTAAEYREIAQVQHACAAKVRAEARAVGKLAEALGESVPANTLVGPFFNQCRGEMRGTVGLIRVAQDQLNAGAGQLEWEAAENLLRALAAGARERLEDLL